MTREELLPNELLERIPPLLSNAETPTDEIIIYVKYFLASFTWLVAECEVIDNDVRFYGYTINTNELHFSEWGSFTLNQLMEIKLYGVLGVERDLYFEECTFSEYMEKGT